MRLGEISDLYLGAQANLAGLNGQVSAERLEQRRFANAVRADDSDGLATQDQQVRHGQQRLPVVADSQITREDHLVAAALMIAQFQQHLLAPPGTALQDGAALFHRLQLLQASLGLRGSAAAHVAADKCFFLADELLLPVIIVAQALSLAGALLAVGAVIAAICLQLSVLNLPNRGGKMIHEVTIVADGEHGARE